MFGMLTLSNQRVFGRYNVAIGGTEFEESEDGTLFTGKERTEIACGTQSFSRDC
jgi:hypothetical protein